jgi:hypothetical protein
MLRLACTGETIPNLPPRAVTKLQFFIHDISEQKSFVQRENGIDTRINDLRELKKDLWSHLPQDSAVSARFHKLLGEEADARILFEDWIDALPFPLASILWAYHATNDSYKKYQLLQRYFEALTQFIATVLLSGFYNSDTWLAERKAIFVDDNGASDELKLMEATFGLWKDVALAFTSDLHKYLAASSVRRTEEQEINRRRCEVNFATTGDTLETLFPKELLAILVDTNTLRNEWRGHGGIDYRVAAERLPALELHLNKTREILGRNWMEYQLILPESSRRRGQHVEQDIQVLMGHRNPSVMTTIQLDEQLDSLSLYVYTPNRRQALKLQPLIHIVSKAAGDQNAAYFFSRVKREGALFISHHYEREPDITERFPELFEFLYTDPRKLDHRLRWKEV